MANGNGGKMWMGVALFLAGCLFTGAGMVIRGDFLGRVAAREVGAELHKRLDRAEKRWAEDVVEIKESLQRIEERQRQ